MGYACLLNPDKVLTLDDKALQIQQGMRDGSPAAKCPRSLGSVLGEVKAALHGRIIWGQNVLDSYHS